MRLLVELGASNDIQGDGTPQEPMRSSSPEKDGAVAYYDVATTRMYEQLAFRGQLVGRAVTLFAIAATILPVAIAALTLENLDWGHCVTWALAVIIGVAFVSVCVCTVQVIRDRGFCINPPLNELEDVAKSYDEHTTRQWVAESCREAHEHNRPILDRILFWMNVLVGSLAALSLALVAISLWATL